jgi:5-methylcytosine-specific restriction protein A
MTISLDINYNNEYVILEDGLPLQIKAATKEKLYELAQSVLDFISLDMECDNLFGEVPRSPNWNKTRNSFVEKHNQCACCKTKQMLQVHHIEPFHTNPDKELDENNLITLCSTCHFVFGHLKKWQSYNPDVLVDVETFNRKIEDRP